MTTDLLFLFRAMSAEALWPHVNLDPELLDHDELTKHNRAYRMSAAINRALLRLDVDTAQALWTEHVPASYQFPRFLWEPVTHPWINENNND